MPVIGSDGKSYQTQAFADAANARMTGTNNQAAAIAVRASNVPNPTAGASSTAGFVGNDGRNYTSQAAANAANQRMAVGSAPVQQAPQQAPSQSPLDTEAQQKAAAIKEQTIQSNLQFQAKSAQDAQKALNPITQPAPVPQNSPGYIPKTPATQTSTLPQNLTKSPIQPPAPLNQSNQPAQNLLQSSQAIGQTNPTSSNLPPNSPSQTTQISSQVPVQTGNQTMIQHTDSTGKISMVTPEEAHKNDINTSLSKAGNSTMEDQMSQILNAPAGTSAAELLKQNLVTELGMINDPTVNQILDNSAQRAKSSYDAGIAMTGASLDEINQAIDGTLGAASTAAGIQAKIYKQNETQQQASLQNEMQYQDQSHTLQMNQLRDNRSNLEGYSKAKLESMGALDSSAGITLLSKINQSADLQIEQANLDYNHAHQQLVLQGNQVMNDYTNQVSSLTQQTNAQKATYMKDFRDSTAAIDDKRLASEQEKNKLRITAFTNYNDKTATLAAQQKTQQLDYLKFAYEKHKDLIDQSYKLSGMMGTVYVPDQDGQLVDTGMPTLDSKKNTQDFLYKNAQLGLDQQKVNIQGAQYNLDISKFGLDQQKFQQQTIVDRGNMVKGYFEQWSNTGFDKTKGAFLEQAMGLSQGSITRFGNDLNSAKAYVNGQVYQAQQGLDQAKASSSQITVSPAVNDIFGVGKVGDWCGVYGNNITTGPKVGDSWQSKLALVTHRDNPVPGQQMVLPLGLKTDGTGWGHDTTVLSFNPTTQDITTIESNHDGRQNRNPNNKGVVTTEHYNLKDLQSKYGNNFGFIPTQFRPDIQQKLSSMQPEEAQVSVYKPPAQANSSGGGFMGTDFSLDNLTSSSGGTATDKTTRDNFFNGWNDTNTPGALGAQRFNTNIAIQHLNDMYEAYKALPTDGSMKTSRDIQNWFLHNTNNSAVNTYLGIRNTVVDEFLKASLGGQPSEPAIKAETEALSADIDPTSMQQIIKAKMNLLGSKVNTIEEQYNSALGVYPKQSILTSDAQKALNSIGIDPANYSPVLKAKTSDPGSIKSSVQSAYNSGTDVNKIYVRLLANPVTHDQVLQAAMSGHQPYQIVQHFLN